MRFRLPLLPSGHAGSKSSNSSRRDEGADCWYRQEVVGNKSTVQYSKHEPHNQTDVSMSHLLLLVSGSNADCTNGSLEVKDKKNILYQMEIANSKATFSLDDFLLI